MNGCYCANYYGSIHCSNTVARFGDRCKLCLALKSGASMSNGLLPEDDLWISAQAAGPSSSSRPLPPRRKDSSRSTGSGTSDTTGRSTRAATLFSKN